MEWRWILQVSLVTVPITGAVMAAGQAVVEVSAGIGMREGWSRCARPNPTRLTGCTRRVRPKARTGFASRHDGPLGMRRLAPRGADVPHRALFGEGRCANDGPQVFGMWPRLGSLPTSRGPGTRVAVAR